MKNVKSLLLILIFSILGISQSTLAAENEPQRSFSVNPILNSDQLDTDKSYFDILAKPGKKEELKLLVQNRGKQSIKVNVQLNNAYTANSGVIAYDKHNKALYNSSVNLQSMAVGKTKTSVKLKPGKSQIVSFEIKVPEKRFKGVVLGGILAYANVDTSRSSQLVINNRINYVSGVVLHSSKSNDHVRATVNKGGVSPVILADSKGIGFTLKNPKSMYIKKLKIKSMVQRKGKNKEKYTKKNMEIAPNSQFQYFVPLNSLKPGDYKANLKITGNGIKARNFNYRFSISAQDIKNAQPTPKRTYTPLFWVIVIAILVIVLGVIIWVLLYYSGRNSGRKNIGTRK